MPPRTKQTAEARAAEIEANRPVDLDLDVLRPRSGSFRSQGRVYYMPAEVPIPLVLEALSLETTVREAKSMEEVAPALGRMYDLIMDSIRLVNDDVPERLMLSRGEIQQLFGLLMSGDGDTHLDEQIIETIRGGGADVDEPEDEDGEAEATSLPPTRPRTGGGGKAAGRSAGRSRSKS